MDAQVVQNACCAQCKMFDHESPQVVVLPEHEDDHVCPDDVIHSVWIPKLVDPTASAVASLPVVPSLSCSPGFLRPRSLGLGAVGCDPQGGGRRAPSELRVH